MKELSTEDQRHVQAAEGWLGLGSPLEARRELEQVTPQDPPHPSVLEVQWQLLASEGQWEACLDIASSLVQRVPDLAFGWIQRSYSLHELKRTAEARDNLLLVVDTFGEEPILRYNLACYECQLGRLAEARNWLRQAFAQGDAGKIKASALEDADLKPLWKDIEEM
jgi:Flp pilus assembly protein TadD